MHWQTYDIIFEAPRFEGETLVTPAYVTVLLNDVVLHHRPFGLRSVTLVEFNLVAAMLG